MDRLNDTGRKALVAVLVPVLLGFSVLVLSTCSVIKGTYRVGKGTYSVGKGTLTTTYRVTKGATKLTIGTGKVVYKLGGFTFKVVKAPFDWPLTREEIETIDDLPPKEAIKKGRVKKSPSLSTAKGMFPCLWRRRRPTAKRALPPGMGMRPAEKRVGI